MKRFALLVVVLLPFSMGAAPGEFVITEPARREFVIGELSVSSSRPPAAISEEDRPSTSVPRPAVVLPKPKPEFNRLPSGYLWTFADAIDHKREVQMRETFLAYMKRSGKIPPEAEPTCSSKHCGTFSNQVTIATGGCGCGCVAGSCNCHHSRNAGKPLSAQTYEPGPLARMR